MTLYTIVDPNVIWAKEYSVPEMIEITWKGVLLNVIRKDDRTIIINRVLSTDPMVYLIRNFNQV